MNVKLLGSKQHYYKFLLQGIGFDIVNSIRRTIMNSVKTMAVDKVVIYKNESVMPDEFLAHRLGLIPIIVDDFDDKTKVSLILNKTGGLVLSGDIEEGAYAQIPYKNIPIVELNDDKEINVELKLRVGVGKEHIKWCPAMVYYYGVPKITQKGILDKEQIELLPPIFEVKNGKVILKDPYDCDIANYLNVVSKGNITVEYSDDDFIFIIESYGNLNINNIISNSSDVLIDKLNELKKQLCK